MYAGLFCKPRLERTTYVSAVGSSSQANYLQRNLLWMFPSEAPKALQASECSELLNPVRASCWMSAQHEPGKFADVALLVLHRIILNCLIVFSHSGLQLERSALIP